jgi:hypothetical protein
MRCYRGRYPNAHFKSGKPRIQSDLTSYAIISTSSTSPYFHLLPRPLSRVLPLSPSSKQLPKSPRPLSPPNPIHNALRQSLLPPILKYSPSMLSLPNTPYLPLRSRPPSTISRRVVPDKAVIVQHSPWFGRKCDIFYTFLFLFLFL